MTKTQFWILNLAAIALAIMVWVQYTTVRSNERLSAELARHQKTVAQARQYEPVLDRLAKRVAQASEKDAQFRLLLVKYGMNVTLEDEGKQKNYP